MTEPVLAGLDAAMAALAELRGRPVVACHGRLDENAARLLHDVLRSHDVGPGLDLMLTTQGGTTTGARLAGGLLHEATKELVILVPLRARSAGTMLCLGADELVLTAVAALGPLDPLMHAAGDSGPAVSAADVKAFRALAEDWFDVPGDAGLALLELLTRQMFPASLAQLHRHDRLAREVALSLLHRHLPDATELERQELVARLVDGYASHDYPILRAEARALGLRVTDATDAETSALLDVADAIEAFLQAVATDGHPTPTLVRMAPEVR